VLTTTRSSQGPNHHAGKDVGHRGRTLPTAGAVVKKRYLTRSPSTEWPARPHTAHCICGRPAPRLPRPASVSEAAPPQRPPRLHDQHCH